MDVVTNKPVRVKLDHAPDLVPPSAERTEDDRPAVPGTMYTWINGVNSNLGLTPQDHDIVVGTLEGHPDQTGIFCDPALCLEELKGYWDVGSLFDEGLYETHGFTKGQANYVAVRLPRTEVLDILEGVFPNLQFV